MREEDIGIDKFGRFGWITLSAYYVLLVGSMFPLCRDDDNSWSPSGYPRLVFPNFVIEDLLLNGVLQPADADHQYDYEALEDLERVGTVVTSAAGRRVLAVVSDLADTLATLGRRITTPDGDTHH